MFETPSSKSTGSSDASLRKLDTSLKAALREATRDYYGHVKVRGRLLVRPRPGSAG